jgi:hypothetical protein
MFFVLFVRKILFVVQLQLKGGEKQCILGFGCGILCWLVVTVDTGRNGTGNIGLRIVAIF